MTFEEFFKKKRIDLVALEQGMQALFSEFKTHFEQMGEKSFDHTKKYWFNKLRRQFPLAPEVKTEKAQVANPLAEQTITESLTETIAAPPPPKLGFVPKFKAGNMPKPATVTGDNKPEALTPPAADDVIFEKTGESAAVKPAYQPKFKMKPKPEAAEDDPTPAEANPALVENTEAKPAYQPRFKMKPKLETEGNNIETPPPPAPDEPVVAKPAYKPRFNMKTLPPKAGE